MTVNTLAGGRYALGRRVGAGGMAEVFLGRDTRLERDVAIKVFRPGTADGIERGSVEARLLAGLDHPGLVRVLDMDTEHASGDGAYLVMEYIPGPDLGVLLRDGPLTRAGVCHVGLDLSRALHHIHHRGVIHRDIKPSNILTRDAEPGSGVFTYLLTDFGIARFFDGSGMTATGQVIGSAAYFSPEQARGDVVGTPTDVYSLGLVLIECLAGERAFPGTGVESALARLHRSPSIPGSAGPALTELLAAMTLHDPAARPDARAVATAFASLDGTSAGTTDNGTVPEPESTHALPSGGSTGTWNPAGEPTAGLPTTAAPSATATTALPAVRAATTAFPAAGPPTTALPSADPATMVFPAAGAPTTALPSSAPASGPTPARVPEPNVAAGPRPAEPVPSSHPAAALPDLDGSGAAPRKRGRGTGVVLAVAAVLLALVVVAVMVLNRPAGPEPEPLPSVSGTTGERLERLYESVNP